jgi:hypothetical protein
MVKQLSAKLLDQLEAEYRKCIKYRAAETSQDHERVINAINSKRRNDFAVAVKNAIESMPDLKGLAVASSITIDYRGYTEIKLSCKLDDLHDPELEKALKQKKKHCELYRGKYAELDEWRINCIKSGEVLPIDIPEIPKQESPYSCG